MNDTDEINDEAAIGAASIRMMKMGFTERRKHTIRAQWWRNEIKISGISKGISEAKD